MEDVCLKAEYTIDCWQALQGRPSAEEEYPMDIEAEEDGYPVSLLLSNNPTQET